MTTFTERHQGSVRSSDDLEAEEGVHDVRRTYVREPGREPARPSRAAEEGGAGRCRRRCGGRPRRDGESRTQAVARRTDPSRRQAHLGARVGPGARGAVRRDPDRKPLGEGVRVRLARRVGPQPERQARARREVRDHQQDGDPLDAEARHQVPQRQGSHLGRRQVLRRENARPAAAGQHLHSRPGAGDRQSPGRLEVRVHPAPEAARRPHHRLLRLAAICADRAGGALRPDQRGSERNRHRPVPDARLRAERPDRVRPQRALLEAGPAVSEFDAAEDPRRRAGPRRGAARRGDRRRNPVRRRRPVVQQRQERHRAERAQRGVPRAADDDQEGPGPAVARPACAPGRQPRDQPRGHHPAGVQRRSRVLGVRSAGLRPLAAAGQGAEGQVPEVRSPQGASS